MASDREMFWLMNKKGITVLVIYDKDDHALIKKHIWHFDSAGFIMGYVKNIKPKSKLVSMHRLVMKITDTNTDIDHINHI